MNDTNELDPKVDKRRQLIVSHLIKDGSKLSIKTLNKLAESLEPFFSTIEDTYIDRMKLRDSKWIKAIRTIVVQPKRIEKIIALYNKIRIS